MSTIIDGMTRKNRLVTDYNVDQGVFKQKLLEADDVEKNGNNNDIVDVNELEAVFLELGLTEVEAKELSKYFFEDANGFKPNGVLDIDKVFEYINIDNDENVSLEEMRLTKKSVTIGTENFEVSDALRAKASEMVNEDGSLNEIKLHEWMNSTPPPSEQDIKIVMYLALKASGYDDEAQIATNLPQIIKEIKETPPAGMSLEKAQIALKHDDPNRQGDVNVYKLKDYLISLGVPEAEANQVISLEGRGIEILEEFSIHGCITLESATHGLNKFLQS